MSNVTRAIEPSLPKYTHETDSLTFDFTDSLSPGETLVSAVMAVLVVSGADSDPAAILSGSVALDTPYAIQLVTGGVRNTEYLISCTVTTSVGRVITSATVLPVVQLGLP